MEPKDLEKIRGMIHDEVASTVKSSNAFRTWRKYDSVTDVYSPITGASGQIGFFKSSKVSQPTTAGASASFTANSGTAVNSASTFDGYTLSQVVKALRNLGLLQ